MSSGVLRFEGSTHFRQRLVCSTLSGRPIRIDNIRGQDQAPGLRDFEACLLRLFEKITDGCVVEINETGGQAVFVLSYLIAGHQPTNTANSCAESLAVWDKKLPLLTVPSPFLRHPCLATRQEKRRRRLT